MAAVYRERYGSEFKVFQNPAELSERLPHARREELVGRRAVPDGLHRFHSPALAAQ